MTLLAIVASLTGIELGVLASLAFVFGTLVILVIGLEQYVFGTSDADPVGLERLERDEEIDDDAWH